MTHVALWYILCMYCKTYFGVNHAIIHLNDVSQGNHHIYIDLNLPCASNESHKNQRFEKTLAFPRGASRILWNNL